MTFLSTTRVRRLDCLTPSEFAKPLDSSATGELSGVPLSRSADPILRRMEPSTRLRLRVSPGSRRSEIVGRYGDGWKVRVSAPPEGGRANDAVVELLSKQLEIPRRSISIVSGHGAREKVVQMDGIDLVESERRLERA